MLTADPFANFLLAFRTQVSTVRPRDRWRHALLDGLAEYRALANLVAGTSLGDGLLTFHTSDNGDRYKALLHDAFPGFRTAIPFAHDWLGRQFAVRSTATGNEVLIFEPGSGESFETGFDFLRFFSEAIVASPDLYLETEFYGAWRANGGAAPRDGYCIGFRAPLFLGGRGEVDNLEETDMDVYWHLCGELIRAIRDQ